MGNNSKGFEFKKFATPRIIGGIAIVVIVLWALSIIFSASKDPASKQHAQYGESPASTVHTASKDQAESMPADHASPATESAAGHAISSADISAPIGSDNHGNADSLDEPAAPKSMKSKATHDTQATANDANSHGTSTPVAGTTTTHQQPAAHQQATTATDHGSPAGGHAAAAQPIAGQHGTTSGHSMPATVSNEMAHKLKPKGVTFVEAVIQPLNYELEERWWGWRPNDIIDLTDDVNNFQMGVLEVTRRATVALAERISRTGTTDAFDENLEQAMNWFMIKASSFWFPSAESKYREGLEELHAYLEKLNQGNATFYTRTDNLIPLLASFEDLLGSCDENLVKQVNEDGTPISRFAVDNYFFYTQGVASSMATVLEAVHHDFLITLESRNATELLHHAIVSCQKAAELDPWIILNSDYSGLFANHRANMAAPISHAYFYIGQLIKTLST